MSDGSRIDERPLLFEVGGETLVGVLSVPVAAPAQGVVIVVGGPQYRVGSHRQFVSLAWALAEAGIAVLRFDYRGMGDSGGALRSFEQVDEDIAAAVDALAAAQPGLQRIALWGLCDGASAALMAAPRLPRVGALVLVNPWARGADTHARTRLSHYYLRRLLSADVWKRALTGRLDLRTSAADLGGNVQQALTTSAASADYRQRMVDALDAFHGPVLWLMSGEDLTAREFETYMRGDRGRERLLRADRCARKDFPETDHTFSTPGSEAAAASATAGWLLAATGRTP